MAQHKILRLAVALCFTALLCDAAAAQTCNVSAEKRVLITAILCGQNASASDYRAQGSGCVEKAFKARLLDTAKQVAVFRTCGDADFAGKLRTGTLQSMKFIQALSTCTEEKIDFDALYAGIEREVAGRSSMLVCTPELKTATEVQRQQLERNLNVALDPQSSRAIEERFSIRVDDKGNVIENASR